VAKRFKECSLERVLIMNDPILEISLTGSDLVIASKVLVWVNDCPFDKAQKPMLCMTYDEVNLFYDRICAVWIEARDRVRSQKAHEARLTLMLSSQELQCLIQCLGGVLEECTNDPLELELRAGDVDDVNRLLCYLRYTMTHDPTDVREPDRKSQ
jgi:hypothetical protein